MGGQRPEREKNRLSEQGTEIASGRGRWGGGRGDAEMGGGGSGGGEVQGRGEGGGHGDRQKR